MILLETSEKNQSFKPDCDVRWSVECFGEAEIDLERIFVGRFLPQSYDGVPNQPCHRQQRLFQPALARLFLLLLFLPIIVLVDQHWRFLPFSPPPGCQGGRHALLLTSAVVKVDISVKVDVSVQPYTYPSLHVSHQRASWCLEPVYLETPRHHRYNIP